MMACGWEGKSNRTKRDFMLEMKLLQSNGAVNHHLSTTSRGMMLAY